MIQYDNSESSSLATPPLQSLPNGDAASTHPEGSVAPRDPTQRERVVRRVDGLSRGEPSSVATAPAAGIVRAKEVQKARASGGKRRREDVSAIRAIWNALAVASMATLIGFGYLSYTLNQDLAQTTDQLTSARNQLAAYESASTTQQDALTIYKKQAVDYQNQATTVQNNYADLQAQSLTLRAEANRLARINASLVAENEQLTVLRQQDQERFALVSAADRIMPLFGTDIAPMLNGTLYLQQDDSGSLILHGLEPLTAAQTYQLWLFTEGGLQIPANLVDVQDSLTPARADLTIRQNIPDFVAAGINIEPVGGSSSPTSPMLMVSQVGQ